METRKDVKTKMKRNLRQILRVIAKSKGFKYPEKMVDRVLSHAQIDSDYKTYLNLTSHNKMPFGVVDADFDCQRFILFREYNNTDFEREIEMFDIYTFSDLKDEGFRRRVKESYQDNFDGIKDLRLFLEAEEVKIWLENEDSSVAILGRYNDLNNQDLPEVYAEIYQLSLKGSDEIFLYSVGQDAIKRKFVELKHLLKPDLEDKKANVTIYTSDNFVVKFGKDVIFFQSVVRGIVDGREIYDVSLNPYFKLGNSSIAFLWCIVDDEEITRITPTARNIANFLMAYPHNRVVLEDERRVTFLTWEGQFLDYCRDNVFLLTELIPILKPLQQGKRKPEPFEKYDPWWEEEYSHEHVIFHENDHIVLKKVKRKDDDDDE